MKNSVYVSILSIIVGLFFIISGIGKTLAPIQFADTIASYGFPRLRFLAPVVTAGEIGLGLMLLFQVHLRRSALVGALLLTVFTLLFAYGFLKHGITSCGCFGAITALQTSPSVSLIRNLVFIIFCIIIYKNFVDYDAPRLLLPSAIGVITFMSLLVLSYKYAVHKPASYIQLAPGQSASVSALAPLHIAKSTTNYLIFVFSPTCPHCWAATPTVMQYQAEGLVTKIIAVSPPSTHMEQEKYLKHFNPSFTIQTLSKAELLKITTQIPAVLLVRNDTITAVSGAPLPTTESLLTLSNGRVIAINSVRKAGQSKLTSNHYKQAKSLHE